MPHFTSPRNACSSGVCRHLMRLEGIDLDYLSGEGEYEVVGAWHFLYWFMTIRWSLVGLCNLLGFTDDHEFY